MAGIALVYNLLVDFGNSTGISKQSRLVSCTLCVSALRTASRSSVGQDDGTLSLFAREGCFSTLLQTTFSEAIAYQQEHL